MIKWNPEAKSSRGLKQDWARYLRSNPPYPPARILKNRCRTLEDETSKLFAEVKRGDVVFAYQARKGKLHGICKVTGKDFRDGHRWIELSQPYAFCEPVNLLRLKRANKPLQKLDCLQPSLPRTLYKLSKFDADLLFSFCP